MVTIKSCVPLHGGLISIPANHSGPRFHAASASQLWGSQDSQSGEVVAHIRDGARVMTRSWMPPFSMMLAVRILPRAQ